MKKLILFAVCVGIAAACSNILITPGASADGSSLYAYAADSGSLMGTCKHQPAADHPAGTKKKIYDWDSGVYLGEIDEVAHTYNTIGNMNEFQLAIGETTFGGLQQLQGQKSAHMDYGSLIWTALQRAKTAREAIAVMGQLVETYGYYSEGESFSLIDPKEVWVMEMIGKGPNMTGAVWVAVRIPDGHVTAHANQARITTFPLNDKETAIYSADVISFARKMGLYNGTDAEFSFSDVYDPVTEVGARICEARVWSFFHHVAEGMEGYLDYLQGRNLTHRMPLSVPVVNKISLNATFWHMRSHNEKSWFDNTIDEGAGPFHAPYRWRPVAWEYNGDTYVNERTISTQQTGWHFVAQARSWLPDEVGGIIWFSADDTSTSVHVPFYSSMTQVPASWSIPQGDKTHSGDVTKFSFDHAFWVFNMVANLAYPRWEVVYPDIAQHIRSIEHLLETEVFQIDYQAEAMLKSKGRDATIAFLTEFSNAAGDRVVKEHLELWKNLFVKYRDGQITVAADATESPACGCKVSENGYDDKWHSRIVADTGSHYLVEQHENDLTDRPATMSKLRYA